MTRAIGAEAAASASDFVRLPRRSVAAATVKQMDRLADEMANGCPSISEAARRLGQTQQQADRNWQRIRRQLGEQAR